MPRNKFMPKSNLNLNLPHWFCKMTAEQEKCWIWFDFFVFFWQCSTSANNLTRNCSSVHHIPQISSRTTNIYSQDSRNASTSQNSTSTTLIDYHWYDNQSVWSKNGEYLFKTNSKIKATLQWLNVQSIILDAKKHPKKYWLNIRMAYTMNFHSPNTTQQRYTSTCFSMSLACFCEMWNHIVRIA